MKTVAIGRHRISRTMLRNTVQAGKGSNAMHCHAHVARWRGAHKSGMAVNRDRQPSLRCRTRAQPPGGPEPGELPDPDKPSSSGRADIPDALPVLGPDADWREFRARLVAGSKVSSSGSDAAGSGSAAGAEWAHVVPKPERGCLLLAHPLMFSDTQTYFNQSVIFMLEHDDTQGSYGLILNRPSRFRISEALRQQAAAQGGGAGADSKEGSVLGSFGDCRLYVGGDVGDGMSLHMIHGQPGLAEAQEVVKGIWMWGLDAARQGLAEGRFRPQDFRWFAKYAGWGPGQLARECQMGVWFAAAASPSVILREPSSADGADLWHHVLTLMGGDYEQLSRNVKEAEAQAQAEAEGKRAAQRGGGDDAAGSAPSSETGGK